MEKANHGHVGSQLLDHSPADNTPSNCQQIFNQHTKMGLTSIEGGLPRLANAVAGSNSFFSMEHLEATRG